MPVLLMQSVGLFHGCKGRAWRRTCGEYAIRSGRGSLLMVFALDMKSVAFYRLIKVLEKLLRPPWYANT